MISYAFSALVTSYVTCSVCLLAISSASDWLDTTELVKPHLKIAQPML